MTNRIVLGKHPDTRVNLSIDPRYARTTTYLVGSPDQGKSTFLGNLAEQFAANGEGVLVLDIKGDLAIDLASRTRNPDNLIYVRMGEVDFGNGDRRYWTINPFEGHRDSTERMGTIRRSVVESFERMGLAQLDTMANIRKTLEISTELALTLPDPTYLDLYLIVADREYRQALLRRAKRLSSIVRREWEDMDTNDPRERMTARERRGYIYTARNRLQGLLTDPNMNLTCGSYHSTIRLAEWLNAGKLVVVDLGSSLPHETGVDLGNLLMAQLLTEVYQRPLDNRDRTWRILVDEFHLFVGKPFAHIITEARSSNVFLVLAHQDRGQLHDDRSKTLTNAIGHSGLTAFFRGSREDRVALAAMYGADVVDEFYELRRHSAMMSYFSRLEGNTVRHPVLLNDWWSEPVPGQFERVFAAMRPMTTPKSERIEQNRRRYWDYLDSVPSRDTRDSDGNKQPKPPKRDPKPRTQVRPEPDQEAEAAAISPEEAERTPRPGRRRPPRALDQPDDPGSLLPRPPSKD